MSKGKPLTKEDKVRLNYYEEGIIDTYKEEDVLSAVEFAKKKIKMDIISLKSSIDMWFLSDRIDVDDKKMFNLFNGCINNIKYNLDKCFQISNNPVSRNDTTKK